MWRTRGVTYWSRWADHTYAGLPASTDVYPAGGTDEYQRRLATMLRVDWPYLISYHDRLTRERRMAAIGRPPDRVVTLAYGGWLPHAVPAPAALTPLRERQLARQRQDWARADVLRRELADLDLVDYPDGTLWLRRAA
jgi:hypothetical protein